MDKEESFHKNHVESGHCVACKTKLHFLNRPVFGSGKLSDGTQICSRCLSRLMVHHQGWAWKISKRYDSKQVREFIQLTERITQAKNKQEKIPDPVLTHEFFTSVQDISGDMTKILQKLAHDSQLTAKLRETFPFENVNTFMAICIGYDLMSVIRFLRNGMLLVDSPENLAFSLMFHRILPEPDARYLKTPELVLPSWLYMTNSPHFDEYADILFRFASIIANADQAGTPEITAKLNQVKQAVRLQN